MTITKKNSKIKKNSKTKKNSLRKKLNISGGALPIYGNIQKSICTLLEEYKKYEKNEKNENHTYGNIEYDPLYKNHIYGNFEDYPLYSEPNKYPNLGPKHRNKFFNIPGPGPGSELESIYSVVNNPNSNSEYGNNTYGNFEDYSLYSEPNKNPNLGPKHKKIFFNNPGPGPGPKLESIYPVVNFKNSNSKYDLPIPDKIHTKINIGNLEVANKFYDLIDIIADRTLLNMIKLIIENKKFKIENLSNEQIKKDIYLNHKFGEEFLDEIFKNETHNELILTCVKEYIKYIIKFIEDNNLKAGQIFIPNV